MINFDDIFSRVEKVSAAAGNVLIFYVKTQEVAVDVMRDAFVALQDYLDDRGISAIFMIDKISLFSVENAHEAKEHLKKCISYIQEAVNKAGDIENGKFRNPIQVQFYCKDAGDQNESSL